MVREQDISCRGCWGRGKHPLPLWHEQGDEHFDCSNPCHSHKLVINTIYEELNATGDHLWALCNLVGHCYKGYEDVNVSLQGNSLIWNFICATPKQPTTLLSASWACSSKFLCLPLVIFWTNILCSLKITKNITMSRLTSLRLGDDNITVSQRLLQLARALVAT